MRTRHHNRRERHTRLVATDDVAERVESCAHAGVTHQANQVNARLLVLLRKIGARNTRRVFGVGGQNLGLLENIDSVFHEGHSYSWSGCTARQCRAMSMRRVTHTRSCFST